MADKADGLSAQVKEGGDAAGVSADTPAFLSRSSPGSVAGESPLYDRGTGTPLAGVKAYVQQNTRFLRGPIRPASVRKGRSDPEDNNKVAALEDTVAQMQQAQLQVQSQLSRLESLIVSSFGSSSISQVDTATSKHFLISLYVNIPPYTSVKMETFSLSFGNFQTSEKGTCKLLKVTCKLQNM